MDILSKLASCNDPENDSLLLLLVKVHAFNVALSNL